MKQPGQKSGGAATCKFCGEPIQWAVNRQTGDSWPLDPNPDPHFGDLLVDEWSWTFVRLELALIERAIARGQHLYVNHLERCTRLAQPGSKSVFSSQIRAA